MSDKKGTTQKTPTTKFMIAGAFIYKITLFIFYNPLTVIFLEEPKFTFDPTNFNGTYPLGAAFLISDALNEYLEADDV